MTAGAILPNAIVVAFLDRVRLKALRQRTAQLEIEVGRGKPGFVVDGQQRLAALSQAGRKDFEVFIIGLICPSANELKKQFILVNSTRPLPKSLIYELLPAVADLPASLSGRADAAKLIERLNYDDNSSLRGAIRTHTNPSGYITDSSFYRVVMNSAADGVIRDLLAQGKKDGPFEVLSNFYGAVQKVFNGAWANHTPKTSRLVHGTGIAALGYVMEALYSRNRSVAKEAFERGLQPLVGKTAWTSGTWRFGRNEVVPWDSLQNVSRDVVTLANYLVGQLRINASGKQHREARRHA